MKKSIFAFLIILTLLALVSCNSETAKSALSGTEPGTEESVGTDTTSDGYTMKFFVAVVSDNTVFERSGDMNFDFSLRSVGGEHFDIIEVSIESDHIAFAENGRSSFAKEEGDYSGEDIKIGKGEKVGAIEDFKARMPLALKLDSDANDITGNMELTFTGVGYYHPGEEDEVDPETPLDVSMTLSKTEILYYAANESRVAVSALSIQDAIDALNSGAKNAFVFVDNELTVW